jgi:peptidoglycan/LPS O-acetylase OafA/YrhL
VLIYNGGPTLLVVGALALHTAGLRCTSMPILNTGDASYALYLTHVMLLSVAQIAAGAALTTAAFLLTAPFAWIIHRYVEKPLIAISRSTRRRALAFPVSFQRGTVGESRAAPIENTTEVMALIRR